METSLGSRKKSPTRTLAEFAANLRFDQIPADVVEQAKLCLLDSLGCALYGAASLESQIVTEVALDWSQKPESTIWAGGGKTSCANAALANGTMVDSFTLDDSHREANLHPSAVTVPVAVAMAERVGGVDGKSFLTALVAGYEVAIRVGMSTCPSLQARGHHGVGSVGGFGSATAAGKILGLHPDRMVHALGIVGSFGGGLMAAQYDSMVKRMHAGKACQNGVLAALLAYQGFTGISDVLEADFGGFCKTYSDSCDMEVITRELGSRFETSHIYFRRYSGSGAVMAAVDAVRELQKEMPIDVDEIEEVVVKASAVAVKHNGWAYSPATAITAQSNISYGVAISLLEGDAFIDQYTEAKLRDPKVLDLTQKVQVLPDDRFSKLGSKGKHSVRLEIRLKNGRILAKIMDRVKAVPPDEIITKFRTLASKRVEPSRVDEIAERVRSLEKLPDVGVLVQALV